MNYRSKTVRTCGLVWATVLGGLLCAWAQSVMSSENPAGEPAHVTIEAIADREVIGPGQTIRVAVVEHIEPGWHTYWVNPGDAGQATRLRWIVPSGYRLDDLQWPVPQVFRTGRDVTYGYEKTVLLAQDVHAPLILASTPATLSVEAQWLACQDICIPGHGTAQIIIRQNAAGAQLRPSRSAALFDAAREELPRQAQWTASLALNPSQVVLTLHGLGPDLPPGSTAQFLPLTWGEIDNAAEQKLHRAGTDVLLTLTRGDLRASPLASLDGVLVLGAGKDQLQRAGYLIHAVQGDVAAHRLQ